MNTSAKNRIPYQVMYVLIFQTLPVSIGSTIRGSFRATEEPRPSPQVCQRLAPETHGRTLHRGVPMQCPRHDLDVGHQPRQSACMSTSQPTQQCQERGRWWKDLSNQRHITIETDIPPTVNTFTSPTSPNYPSGSATHERYPDITSRATNHDQRVLHIRGSSYANLHGTLSTSLSHNATAGISTSTTHASSNFSCYASNGMLLIKYFSVKIPFNPFFAIFQLYVDIRKIQSSKYIFLNLKLVVFYLQYQDAITLFCYYSTLC